MESILEKYHKILLPVFLFFYGVFLWIMCYHSRGIPVTDSASLNMGALYMAGLSEEISWTYFARWSNNIMPAVLLGGGIYRIGRLLGLEDVYYAALFANVLQVVIAMYCTFQICCRMSGKKKSTAWLGMFLLGSYFAVFEHTQSLYTDAFSF
ncbi:MAG: hypothetical protein NC305_19145, partial [Lachnospiraceae bacterium]|nr:hypothetical protein [Lachnospiraceae bacterium]